MRTRSPCLRLIRLYRIPAAESVARRAVGNVGRRRRDGFMKREKRHRGISVGKKDARWMGMEKEMKSEKRREERGRDRRHHRPSFIRQPQLSRKQNAELCRKLFFGREKKRASFLLLKERATGLFDFGFGGFLLF